MTDSFSLPPIAAEPSLHVAQRSLTLLKTVPALASRYAENHKVLTLDDVAALPPLVKDDLNVALAHLKPKAETGATWLFQSGGSTGAPKVGYAPTGFYMTGVYDQWRPLDDSIASRLGKVEVVRTLPISRMGYAIDTYTLYRAVVP